MPMHQYIYIVEWSHHDGNGVLRRDFVGASTDEFTAQSLAREASQKLAKDEYDDGFVFVSMAMDGLASLPSPLSKLDVIDVNKALSRLAS